MSLMFAALKKLETPASSPVNASAFDVVAGHDRGRLRRPLMLAIPALALLGGWWLFPTGATPRADIHEATTIASAPALVKLSPSTMTTVGSETHPADTTRTITTPLAGAIPQSHAVPAIPTITAPELKPGPDPVVTNPSTAPTAPQAAHATREQQPNYAVPTPRAPAQVPPQPMVDAISVRDASDATADGQSVSRAVAALGTAINNDDLSAAAEHLALLTQLLPPQSLTLLRMQAWLAHESGDTAGALAMYRRIVARMPGDQTAVINLAILEARNGEAASARLRLQRLRSRDAGSLEIERAISLVEAQLQ